MPQGKTTELRSFNLLPWRERQRTVRQRQAFAALAGGVLVACLLLAAIELPLRERLHSGAARIAELQRSISIAKRGTAERDALEASTAQSRSILAEVERIRYGNAVARDWLAALPEQIPPGLQLTQVSLQREAWQLRGLAAELELAQELLARVRKLPMVDEVRMERLGSATSGPREFALNGQFRK